MELFDTHCHLDVEAFDNDRQRVLASSRMCGVKHLLIPAIQQNGWDRLWDLCESDPGLYPALGLHPVLLEAHRADDIARLQHFVGSRRPVAIGEIGLDFAIRSLDRDRQEELLQAQLDIAVEHDLPVILHVRKAHEPMLKILRSAGVRGGICHAFNGSMQQAQRYLDLGFVFGFGGMLTYPNARHLRELAESLPLDSIVLETDAPDMSGANHRYQRNSPEYLPEVLDVVAGLRNMDPGKVARHTSQNARRVLRLDDQE